MRSGAERGIPGTGSKELITRSEQKVIRMAPGKLSGAVLVCNGRLASVCGAHAPSAAARAGKHSNRGRSRRNISAAARAGKHSNRGEGRLNNSAAAGAGESSDRGRGVSRVFDRMIPVFGGKSAEFHAKTARSARIFDFRIFCPRWKYARCFKVIFLKKRIRIVLNRPRICVTMVTISIAR